MAAAIWIVCLWVDAEELFLWELEVASDDVREMRMAPTMFFSLEEFEAAANCDDKFLLVLIFCAKSDG